jgi:AhpD family alkylhydroperoxidase
MFVWLRRHERQGRPRGPARNASVWHAASSLTKRRAADAPTSKGAKIVTTDYKARIGELDEYYRELRKLVPDAMSAFSALTRAAQSTGALDKKTKELLALAIAVATHCEGCIAYHARGAARTGATRQEVAETLAVAIQMGGGPNANYAADALRAFDQFCEEIVRATSA